MTLTIKLDRNWNSFQLANSAPPLSVTDSVIDPSARIIATACYQFIAFSVKLTQVFYVAVFCCDGAITQDTGSSPRSNRAESCELGPEAPPQIWKSHWCAPFTATCIKRRKIGALWNERCDAEYLKMTIGNQEQCERGRRYPGGCAAPSHAQCYGNTRGHLSKLKVAPPQTKIKVTSKSPVGDISVAILLRHVGLSPIKEWT